jgi:hypothetical protein
MSTTLSLIIPNGVGGSNAIPSAGDLKEAYA